MRFLTRVFYRIAKLKKSYPDSPDYQRASGFWAAKEALVKATGLGFRNGISFQDMEIDHDELGCPHYVLRGKLSEIMQEKGIRHISLSISHCATHAIAVTFIS
jgi:Phosphopantetheinyl transferase (holo-ACP synthase)